MRGRVWELAAGTLWFWLKPLEKACEGEQAFCKGEVKTCLVAFEATSIVFWAWATMVDSSFEGCREEVWVAWGLYAGCRVESMTSG